MALLCMLLVTDNECNKSNFAITIDPMYVDMLFKSHSAGVTNSDFSTTPSSLAFLRTSLIQSISSFEPLRLPFLIESTALLFLQAFSPLALYRS